MHLEELTSPELILPQLQVTERNAALRALARRIVELGHLEDADVLYDRLLEREELGSTAVGGGVAIPHCKMEGLSKVIMAVGITKKGIDFEAADGQPVRLLFAVVSPSNSPAAHLQCLAAISKWVKVGDHIQGLFDLTDADSIYERLRQPED